MTDAQKRRVVLVTTLGTLLLILAAGTVLFRALEDWTWIQSFYFTVVTITTVGYGDIVPSNDTTRLLTAIFILFGVGVGAGIISYFGGNALKRRVESRMSPRNVNGSQARD